MMALALLLVAMPFAVFAQSDENDSSDSLCVDRLRKHDYYLMEANCQKQLGNHDAALELYEYCLQLNPKSDVALFEIAKYMTYLQEDSVAEEYLVRAVGLVPDNYWYASGLANVYVGEGRTDEAIEVLENLCVKHPKKSDVLGMLINLYARNEDYKNVVRVLEQLEVKEGKSEMISTEKFRAYLLMGDEERAYAEIVNLAEEYPHDLRYRVLLGDMYMEYGHTDEAYEVYKAVEQEDSTNLNVMLSLADFYKKQGQDSLYQTQVEKLVLKEGLSNDIRLEVMTSVAYANILAKEDSTKVLNLFRKILTYPQENNDMAELYVRFMTELKMSEDSIKPVLNKMLEADPESELVRSQLLSYAMEKNDTSEIYRLCKSAVDIPLKNTFYHYVLGVLYYQRGELDLVMETLDKALAYADENTNIALIVQSYNLLGDLYYELGNVEASFAAYDSCLMYKPDEVGVLNNYAYYLSLQNRELERAKEMSGMTIKAEPDNYIYLDTYAWILFMLEEYEGAKEYIDKALVILGENFSSDDSNIIEHAGDIYYKAGDKDGAVRLWLKAQELGGDSKVLQKKIKKKKYLKK